MALFDNFVTSSLIKVAWIVGTIFIGIWGIFLSIAGGSQHGALALLAVLLTVFLILVWRIICELTILFFKMNESIVQIRKNTDDAPQL